MNFLIFFGICSTPKLSKLTILFAFTYKVIQWVPIDSYSSRFISYAPSFILGKLVFSLISAGLQISAAHLSMHIEISSSRLIRATPLNTAHIRMVTIFYYKLNQNIYSNKNAMEVLLIFRFFHYIWFIDSENLCLILILKEKMTKFWHAILFISVTLK